jgi:hypothetical protein
MDFQSVENAIVVARIKLECKYTLPSFRISVRDYFDVPVSRKIICTHQFKIQYITKRFYNSYSRRMSLVPVLECI